MATLVFNYVTLLQCVNIASKSLFLVLVGQYLQLKLLACECQPIYCLNQVSSGIFY